jgi:universal stress protein E
VPNASRERARATAAEAGCDADLVVVRERPWLAMVRSALRGEADLLCVGRRSLADRPGVGSVALKLLHNSPAPVWAVRPGAPAPPARILIATDLSPAADRATELALELARLAGADVRVLHAWQVPLALQMSEGRTDQAVIDAKRRELQEHALEHVRGTLGEHAGVHVQIHVVCDAPTRAIERDAGEHGADLVALGSVSRGGIAGFLVGNTAERLLRRIETSVLAVKPADFVCPVEA